MLDIWPLSANDHKRVGSVSTCAQCDAESDEAVKSESMDNCKHSSNVTGRIAGTERQEGSGHQTAAFHVHNFTRGNIDVSSYGFGHVERLQLVPEAIVLSHPSQYMHQ